jgi:endonuclease-3
VTGEASARLFRLAVTPRTMADLPAAMIARTIYPAGFYRTKAATIRGICRTLLDRHDGKVPDTMEDLLALKGVGRKTANLVLTIGFGKPGICVDTHVHRISNRLGIVATKTPEQSEFALRQVLPPRYWIPYNDLLVTFGQNVCKPISPLCSDCPVQHLCPQLGVGIHR